VFKKMDIGKFTIRVNNRKVLNGFFASLGTAVNSANVLRIVDKADKMTQEKLLEAFGEIGLNPDQIDRLLAFMSIKGSVDEVLAGLRALGLESELFNEGIDELAALTSLMSKMGVAQDYFTIDLSIARGLDYYTGTVYETTLDDTPIGSICGGGRYDNLASAYTNEKLPGVGISIGLSRLFYQLKENGLLDNAAKSVVDVIVMPEREQNTAQAVEAAGALRAAGLNVDMFFEDINMKKKLQYVTKKDAPYVVFARTNEQGDNYLSLQYKDGDEVVKETMPLAYIVARLKH